MFNVVFVVLHYQNIIDTINCLDSIKKLKHLKKISIHIVVIDNFSPNGTGKKLYDMYADDEMIEVVLLDKNYGFSIANNIGYKKSMNHNPDVIIMSNNDIIIDDRLFLTKLFKVCNEQKEISIIAPDIINFKGFHQNPLRNDILSIKKSRKNMIYKFGISIFIKVPIINKFIFNFEKKRLNKWLNNYYNQNQNLNKKDFFVPFGAFIIYCKNWIEKENFAFPSDTFMYLEEDYLGLYCKIKKYKLMYCNELVVNHLEGRSVQSSTKNEYKALSFKYKNEYKALKKYIKYSKQMRGRR